MWQHQWIQFDARLFDRPELLVLATDTDESFSEAGGRLIRFWGWFEKFSKEGRIKNLGPRTLARTFGGTDEFWVRASSHPCDFLGIDELGITGPVVPGKYYSISRKQKAFDALNGDAAAIIAEHYKQRREESLLVIASPKLRSLIMERDGAKCKWCGDTEHLALDHILPVDAGGDDEPDNLQLLCCSCNSSKGNRIPSTVRAAI